MAPKKNIARIADHPMFGKDGQKGAPPSSSGRKIIPFTPPATPPGTFASPPPSEPSAEEVCRFLKEELRQGKI